MEKKEKTILKNYKMIIKAIIIKSQMQFNSVNRKMKRKEYS